MQHWFIGFKMDSVIHGVILCYSLDSDFSCFCLSRYSRLGKKLFISLVTEIKFISQVYLVLDLICLDVEPTANLFDTDASAFFSIPIITG